MVASAKSLKVTLYIPTHKDISIRILDPVMNDPGNHAYVEIAG